MHDTNEMECLIFEIAIKNIVLGKVTKVGFQKQTINSLSILFQQWGHIDPNRSLIGLTLCDRGYFRQLTIRWGFKSPRYDLENYCINLHNIIHVDFYIFRRFRHIPIGTVKIIAILIILQRF